MKEKPLPRFAVVCGAGRLCEGYTYPGGDIYMEAQDNHPIRARHVGSRKMSQEDVTNRLKDCNRCRLERGRLCDANASNSLTPQDLGAQTGSGVHYFENTPRSIRHIELAIGKVGLKHKIEYRFDVNVPMGCELPVMIYNCTPEAEAEFIRLKDLYSSIDL